MTSLYLDMDTNIQDYNITILGHRTLEKWIVVLHIETQDTGILYCDIVILEHRTLIY